MAEAQGVIGTADAEENDDIFASLLQPRPTSPAEQGSTGISAARAQLKGIVGKFRTPSRSQQPESELSSRGLGLRSRKRTVRCVQADSDYEEDDDDNRVIDEVPSEASAAEIAKSSSANKHTPRVLSRHGKILESSKKNLEQVIGISSSTKMWSWMIKLH